MSTLSERGSCECGCGEATRLAPYSDRTRGWVKGNPIRFVVNHHRRKSGPEYLVEDRGFVSPCWIWQRTLTRGGYGHMGIGARKLGMAHRVYYERRYGRVSRELQLDHLCRHRACVNPEHLEVVSPAENSRRGVSTKLTAEIVREIRERLDAGDTGRAIATETGVTPALISRIKLNQVWRGI